MSDYAEIPPGRQFYNPRRQRRHDRKTREMAATAMARRAKLAEAQARRDEVRARVANEKQGKSFMGRVKSKVKGFTQKLFGRKTG